MQTTKQNIYLSISAAIQLFRAFLRVNIIEFKEMIEHAQLIRDQYAEFEKKKYGRTWTDEEIAMGLVGDIGDLMKLIQAQNKIRDIPDYREKLKHELADCLWSLIVIANLYEIDLEEAFVSTMNELELHLRSANP